MPKQKVDLRKVFQPQDSIAFLVIAIGLFIALFLDEMSVRLIGICITVLGGVALFMIVSPRLTDLQIITPVRPSQTPDLGSRTISDATKTSQTFDPEAYRESFGLSESEEKPFVDDRQFDLFAGSTTPPTVKPATPAIEVRPAAPFIEHSEGESGFRVVGTRKAVAPQTPQLVSERKFARNVAEAAAKDVPPPPVATEPPTVEAPPVEAPPPFAAATAVITGPITEAIALSEDVIVRPKSMKDSGAASAPPASTPPPATAEPPAEPTEKFVPEPEISAEVQDAPPNDAPPVEEEHVAITAPALPLSRVSPASLVFEDDEDMASEEPRREFDYLLNRVLMVIRSATNARTAAFLWVNHEREQLVVEAKITEAEAEFTTERKIPMSHDALSQIAREGRPEIITHISAAAERDLLPYYVRPAQTMSFIGVPVYYAGNVVGILCADSKIEDAYTDITVGFFGQFTKLISGLVSSYTAKYDLLQASQTLEAMQAFHGHLDGMAKDVKHVVRALFTTLIHVMDISRMGAVTFDGAARSWTLADARSALADGYRELAGTAIDLRSSAIGQTIETGSIVSYTHDYTGVRVTPAEPPLEYGQFVAVPLCTDTESYGALFFENLESTLSQQDIALAAALGREAGKIINGLRTVMDLERSSLLDTATGALNTHGFEMRIREEFARAVDYNLPFTLCRMSIDPSRTLPEQQEQALAHILKLVREQLRDYDIVARVGTTDVALGLIGYKLQEAQNWTESMRRTIASTPVDVDGKRVAFTVSVGVAQAEPRDAWDDLIAHAEAALDVSKRTGNKVTVFA